MMRVLQVHDQMDSLLCSMDVPFGIRLWFAAFSYICIAEK